MRSVFTASLIGGSALFSSAQSVPLAEALDSPDLSWSTDGGDVPFQGILSPGHVDGDVAWATISPGQRAEISTPLTGAGIIDFWIHAGGLNNWTAQIDDTVLDLSTGSWPFGFRVDGEGPHLFTISYQNTQSATQTVFIDAAIFRPDQDLPLGEALDHPGLTWTTSGDQPWSGTPYFAHDETDAARSGQLEIGETSILQTTVDGPAEVRFCSRLPSSSGLTTAFSINGVESPFPTHRDWKQHTLIVGPGSHTLRWEAIQEHAPTNDHPASGLWLDQFSLTAIEEGFLTQFATPEFGTSFRGDLFKASPGFMDDSALGLDIAYCRNNALFWPLPPSDKPRRILFHVKNAGGSVQALNNSISFGSSDDWQPVSIIASPKAEGVQIYASSSDTINPALIDDLILEELPTIPASEVLGPIAGQFSFDGWHGWPSTPESNNAALVSTSYGSVITGTVTGPAWLSYDAKVIGNGLIILWVGEALVQSSSSLGESPSRYLIPSGDHQVSFVHAEISPPHVGFDGWGSEAWATIRNLGVSPIPTLSLSHSTFEFSTSGTSNTSRPEFSKPIESETFFRSSEGIIHGIAGADQTLSLSTQLEGPALFSFERKVAEHREGWPKRNAGTVFPSCTSGTITIMIGPGPDDPGTSTTLDDYRIQGSGISLVIPLDAVARPVEEPMNPATPNTLPSGLIAEFGHRSPGTGDGWEKTTLYLREGSHEITWRVGSAPNDADGHFAQWRQLSLTNLKLTPILPDYQNWANRQWSAAPEAWRPDVTLGPWQNPLMDPDRDGANNAMEFAFGSDPRSNSSHPKFAPSKIPGSSGILWGPTAPGITWKTYFSRDLETWSETEATTFMTPEGLTSQANQPGSSGYFRIEPSVIIPTE